MSKAIYIATTGPNSGKSIISLGLMELLLGKTAKVGYFRPVIDDLKHPQKDNHINTITSYFNLDQKFEEAFAFKHREIVEKKQHEDESGIMDGIISKFKAMEERFDFVLVEGTDFSREGAIFEWDMNALIAKNLGIPSIVIANGAQKTPDELVSHLRIAYDSFMEKGAEVLLVVANKVSPDNREAIYAELKKSLPDKVLVSVIPRNNKLSQPTIKEILEEVEGEVLFGEEHINNQAGCYSVGAMQLRNYLTHLKKDSMVITPGDRADIILGALQAHQSVNYPSISGIILTGGLIPEAPVMRLIDGLTDVFPVISAKEGTFALTNRIGQIKPRIYAENIQKITASIRDFETYVPVTELEEKFNIFEAAGVTPRMFQYHLLKKAQNDIKHIVLPEGTDERILRATARLLALKAAEVTLLGDRDEIEDRIQRHDIKLDLDKVSVIDPRTSEKFDAYAKTLYELRKHKNVNAAMARDLMEDVSYFGSMMVYNGDADGMVSGAVHTTQHTIRPALQFIKTRPGVSLVSSIFFMCLDDRVTVFGDCAINPNPTAAQLAEIAMASADSSAAFGIEPRVAMLSYSSGTSGMGEDVDKVREATRIVKEKRPELKIEGPIQYDAAVDMKVGKSKLPDSEVAGRASVFIFPDLNTGNNTYKAVQRETGALAIGPMLQGLNKPVNDLSRGCTADDIFNTVVITAIQAQGL